ncbi:MAG: bifunctional nicotinamidase/pyrazinamidase [Deltaproteobacteria bacterium]|nr:bifunctional nicotinamidase/pyrazinamidase [Deltaproteobacteria bacterium]
MEALIIVDVQNDFCPGGALAVPEGDLVVPVINAARGSFKRVVLTQDWHPAGHKSFASAHPGKQVYDLVPLGAQQQVLWPDHCVQNSTGAEFHPKLTRLPTDNVFRKGTLPMVDSYSGFLDNDKIHETGLRNFLLDEGVTRLTVAGLATDYCVKFTVLDALRYGFQVKVLKAGCRAVNLQPGDGEKAFQEMGAAGAEIV